ncbi:hypothetical protein NMYAN_20255 [Nitrosomonas nitrosa]|uniref:Uncharacterized protein n=1 Tax=Nitrosomonas nitrosa TaxID=52442 RepID=A0A8H8YZ63_9PROT|nr:hypothetical protein NMYAN_20255 [Nitrosomonas nitrosa]
MRQRTNRLFSLSYLSISKLPVRQRTVAVDCDNSVICF